MPKGPLFYSSSSSPTGLLLYPLKFCSGQEREKSGRGSGMPGAIFVPFKGRFSALPFKKPL